MSEELNGYPEVDVKPTDIEQALRKLIVEKNGGTTNNNKVGKPSVLLSNFVFTVFSPLAKAREQLDDLLGELAVMMPSRFFIVSLVEDDIKELKTAVNVREIRTSTGNQFLSEEIFISASKETLPLISSLLRHLFISDVPIISYIIEEPGCDDKRNFEGLLLYLKEVCDLFLFDSQKFKSYARAVSSLISLRRIIRPHKESESRKLAPTSVRLRDLNWYRHEKIRALLAGLFDTSNFTSSSIKEVEVVVNQKGISPTGLLLAGWLKEALGERDIVKLSSVALHGGESSSYIKLSVRGDSTELSVSQDGEKFEVCCGGSVRALSSKPLTTAQLMLLPIQSSGLDDYFTKSLEQSLFLAEKWA